MNEQTLFKKLYKACKVRHAATKGKCAEGREGCDGLGYCEEVFKDIEGVKHEKLSN